MADDTICSQCGYDLQGLRRVGACPECGQDYNVDAGTGVVGDRSERMRRADFVLARIRTISLAVVAVIVFGLTGLLAMALQSPRPVWVGSVLAGVFVLGAIVSYMYERD